MPNASLLGRCAKGWELSAEVAARELCELRQKHAQQGFPLPLDKIQLLACSPEALGHFHALQDLQEDGSVNRKCSLWVGVPKGTFGLDRGMMLFLELSSLIFYGRRLRETPNMLDYEIGLQSTYVLTEHAAGDHKDVVAAWLKLVLRENRIAKLTEYTVNRTARLIESTGELLANAPWLVPLVQEQWIKDKLKAPPTRLRSYKSDAAWFKSKPVRAVETVLAGAEFLTDFDDEAQPVRVLRVHTQQLSARQPWEIEG